MYIQRKANLNNCSAILLTVDLFQDFFILLALTSFFNVKNGFK